MPVALNNTASTDVNQTLACTGAVVLNILVTNAAILYSYDNPVSGGSFGPDAYLAPGFYSLRRRCNNVRFKSAAAGVPARVTIEAQLPSDISPA